MLVYLTVSLAVTLAVLAVYAFVDALSEQRRTMGIRRWVEKELGKRQRERARKSLLLLNRPAMPDVAEAPPVPGGAGLHQRLQALIEQAGMFLTPWQLLAISVVLALVAGAAGALLAPAPAVAAGLTGLLAPFLSILRRRHARAQELMTQLPRAFELMARVIRAGHSVSLALEAVVEEFDPPLATEFAYCQEQQRLGLLPEVAFRELSQRSEVMELKIFVMAILVQQKTGGNLSDLLERLGRLIRERIRVQGVIRTVTAEGRLQAHVLMALPPLMFLLLMFLHPHYVQVLVEHYELLIAATISMALGGLWIRSIVRFDF
jgi:tight adherence protein B